MSAASGGMDKEFVTEGVEDMGVIEVPVVISGIEVLRRAIMEISIVVQQSDAPSDYVAGFMDCRECLLRGLDELEKVEEENLYARKE